MKKTIKKIIKKTISEGCNALPVHLKCKVAKLASYTLKQVAIIKENTPDQINIAVRINGGLGDSLICLAFLKEIYKLSSQKITFDIFGRIDFLHHLTLMQPYIENIYDRSTYDFAQGYNIKLTIVHFVEFDYIDERISEINPEICEIIKSISNFNNKFNHYIRNQPLFDGAWAAYCTLRGWDRWSELSIDKKINFSQNIWYGLHLDITKFDVLDKFELKNSPYITIHAGCDTSCKFPLEESTKIWPQQAWKNFYEQFKKRHPEIKVVHIGSERDMPIEGCDISLCGKIGISEACIVLKHSLVHIGGESGLVHLRRQLGGRSVVLFGPTPEPYFGYEQNINIVSDTCKNCMWMTEDWNHVCPNGFSIPRCMQSISPQKIIDATEEILVQKKYSYSTSDIQIYSSDGRKKYENILNDICEKCGVAKKSISEHIFGESRTYIHASKQWEYPYAIAKISECGKKLRIADIGGGRGMLSSYLTKKGHDVSVYDINFLWDNKDENGENEIIENTFFALAKKQGFHADYGSIFNIPAFDCTFDIVTCISVVEHIPHKEFAIKEMLRVLKPGGKLILTYDLCLGYAIGRDSIRVETFTPDMIRETMRKLNIAINKTYDNDEVIKSIHDIEYDKVIFAEDMTAGALTINKEISHEV